MGSLPGIIGAFAKLEKWLKTYAAGEDARKALDVLDVGGVHRAEIDRQVMPRFRGGKKRRYGIRVVEIERLKDAE
jgi:hypothetical protein